MKKSELKTIIKSIITEIKSPQSGETYILNPDSENIKLSGSNWRKGTIVKVVGNTKDNKVKIVLPNGEDDIIDPKLLKEKEKGKKYDYFQGPKKERKNKRI
jgi:hypothetical protein